MNPTAASGPAFRSVAEINSDALRHNVNAIMARVGGGVKTMAVVKANAYGHGATRVTEALAGRVEMFGVANVAEAIEIEPYTSGAPILILGPALPEEREEIAAHGFIPCVSDLMEARAFAALAKTGSIRAHLVLDTGMGRIGVWQEDAIAVAREVLAIRGIEITGIASHLPVADEDDAFTEEQLSRFHQLVAELRRLGVANPVVHVENSAGAIGFPSRAGDMIRLGLAMYGSSPRPEFQAQLQPALTWKARITLLRDVGEGRGVSYGRTFITPRSMRIATVGVGYADGYQRHLSNKGAEVLIGGRRCAVLGRVTMDQILVDVSAVPAVRVGDEAVLIGRQGADEILASELAEKAGTIPWEIFTGIGRRVQRRSV